MNFLNPFDKERKAAETKATVDNKNNRAERLKKRAAARKSFRKHGRKFIANYNKELSGANARSEQDYKDYIRSMKVGKDAILDSEKC